LIRSVDRLRWLGGKSQSRGAGTVKNDKLAFEEDVTKYGFAKSRIGLDATKAF
jgi:hypothetical protein